MCDAHNRGGPFNLDPGVEPTWSPTGFEVAIQLGDPTAHQGSKRSSITLQDLPNEILVHILWMCTPPFTPYRRSLYDAYQVLSFGLVSRHIRQVAYSSPTLWSTATFRPKASQTISHIILWLARAGSVPLSLRIDADTSRFWEAMGCASFMEALHPYIIRCKDLDLRIPLHCFTTLPRSPQSLPQLRTLSLKLYQATSNFHSTPGFPFNEAAPNIHTLSLSRLWIRNVHFDWGNLTTLELQRVYIDECLFILNLTPKLVHFTLRKLFNGGDGHKIPDHPILLLSLATFDWTLDMAANASAILLRVMAPSLTHFRFCPFDSGWVPAPSLLHFIRSCGQSLSVVVMMNVLESDAVAVWSCGDHITFIEIESWAGSLQRKRRMMRPELTKDILSLYDGSFSQRWGEVLRFLPAVRHQHETVA